MKVLILNLITVAVLGSLISSTQGAPSGKDKVTKLKAVLNDKEGSKITEEERRFLKEVEAKFKINTKENDKVDIRKILEKKTKGLKLPFPAVIAVEIVNDTTPDGKGKRTIDANLGYGYKTDNGYFYQKFGQEEKGKFMIYPYSQHDIPPAGYNFKQNNQYSAVYTNKHNGDKTFVEIQPSRAFQLVPVDSGDHENSYNPNDVVSYLKTKYESVQAVETPPPPQYSAAEDYYQQHSQTEKPTTFYSTYNGQGQLSGFSGHFPSVMSNYFVNPSQLFGQNQHQEYSSVQHEVPGPKRVIPVFILRIPSSQISHEHASAFNQLNLQALVTQYLAQLQPFIFPPKNSQSQHNYYHSRTPYSEPIGAGHYAASQAPFVPSQPVSYTHAPQYEEEQPKENVQYVPQFTKSRGPGQTFSQVYTNLAKGNAVQQASQYTHSEENSQNLPISENYPDHHHTRVVFKPQYVTSEQEETYQDDHTQGYTTAAPENVQHVYQAVSHRPQIRVTYNGHAVPDETQEAYESYANAQEEVAKEEDNGEQQYQYVQEQQYQTQQEETQSPYNYHAHPYPKRQIKSTTPRARSAETHQRKIKRPLRSGSDTAVVTKL